MAQPRVLVFTKTTGYRHDSIPIAIEVLKQQEISHNVSFTFTENSEDFTDDALAAWDSMMFISTTGADILDGDQQAALQRYFQSGGNFVGVHAASDCLSNASWFVQELGARFDYHPTIQSATFLPLNNTHPSLVNVPDRWTFTEEVYNFRSDARAEGAVVIMTVDETSYQNNGTSTGSYTQGTPHPIAWYQTDSPGSQPLLANAPGPGRSFYTSLGHLNETWQNETFIGHIMGGLQCALESGTTKAFNSRALVGNGSSSTGSANTTTTATSGASSAAGSSTSTTASAGTQTSQSGGGVSGSLADGKLAAAAIGLVGLMAIAS